MFKIKRLLIKLFSFQGVRHKIAEKILCDYMHANGIGV